MKLLPHSKDPLVVRSSFDDQKGWQTVAGLIRAPVLDGDETFYAHVQFLNDRDFQDCDARSLLARSATYPHHAVFIIDKATLGSLEYPVLVADLYGEPGRTFRALPGQVQAIENNLSITNMNFAEFADSADADGVFRGYRGAQTCGPQG